MFWKKKISKKDLIEYESTSRRETFRLSSRCLEAIYANFGGNIVKMVNLSAGGASFESETCAIGDVKPFVIELHGRMSMTLSTPAEILAKSNTNVFHCKFLHIDSASAECIHQYVLFKQITQKRKQRANKNTDNT